MKNKFNLCLICSEDSEINEENKYLGSNVNLGYSSKSEPDERDFQVWNLVALVIVLSGAK